MHRQPHYQREIQLSTTVLTPRVAAGETAIAYGMRGERQHQPERRTLPRWHVAFAHDPLSRSAG